jgi:hypothetical protein
MNGSEWYKNDTSYYAVYYTNSYGERELDVVTNNFGGWLKQSNKERVNEGQEPYDSDDFQLVDVEVFSRGEK